MELNWVRDEREKRFGHGRGHEGEHKDIPPNWRCPGASTLAYQEGFAGALTSCASVAKPQYPQDRTPALPTLRAPESAISSIKGVKKKHFTCGRSFSCRPAHPIEQDCSRRPFQYLGTLTAVAWRVWFSLPAVFIASSRRSQSSETNKQKWFSVGNHGSIWDSQPIAFSGYPRGTRVGCETSVPEARAV